MVLWKGNVIYVVWFVFFYVVNLNAQASWNVSILLETRQQVIMLYVPQRTLWPPEEGFIDQDS